MENRKPKVWCYFGDCRNTVDVDNIGDATQMAGVVGDSKKVSYKPVLKNGDRNIPKSIGKKGNIVTINNKQKIGIVYNPKTDIHHFFDVEDK